MSDDPNLRDECRQFSVYAAATSQKQPIKSGDFMRCGITGCDCRVSGTLCGSDILKPQEQPRQDDERGYCAHCACTFCVEYFTGQDRR